MVSASRQSFYRQLGLWTDERLGRMLPAAAEMWSEREFIYFEGARYSFRQMNDWALATAHELLHIGVRPADKVLLQVGNRVELLVLLFAAWRIGVVAVPVVPIYRAHEMREIIAHTRPAVIAASCIVGSRSPYRELDEILAADASGYRPLAKIVIGGDGATPGWREFLTRPLNLVSDTDLPEPASAEVCNTILFTSGTTSTPKGAMLNSHSLISSATGWRRLMGLSMDDTALTAAPLAHIGSLYPSVIFPLSIGGRTLIMSKWSPDEAVDLIDRERATYMAGAMIFLQDIVERYENGAGRNHRIRLFSCGGAPTPPQLIQRAHAQGITAAFRGYGMTETAGAFAFAPVGRTLEKCAHYDGKVAYGHELEIVDDSRRPLSYGQLGHIRLRGPQLMMGYTDPVMSSQHMDEDGWFYPGDLGTVTEDGWMRMTGRSKDIINRGGEKFSAQDIEVALASAPGISHAAVTGVPDKRFGEAVAAFLVLQEGNVWSGPEPVLLHLEQLKLARQKFPIEWHVMDELPRTGSGKVQKQKLLELALGKRSRTA